MSFEAASPASYSPTVIEHFERPRNVGHFEPAPDVIAATAGRRDQGVQFHLSAQLAGPLIRAVRFEVYGCPHCIAAGSWLSQRLVAATLQDLRRWSWREAAEALQMPAEKRGRLLILEDAVRALAEAWARKA